MGVGGMPVMLEIDYNKCDGCGTCVSKCPSQAVSLVNGKPSVVRPQDCNYCTECEQFCTTGAIRAPFEIVMADPGIKGTLKSLLPALIAISATSFVSVFASYAYSAS